MKIPNFCLVLLLLAVACDTLVTDTGDVVTDSGVAFLSLQADLTQEASQLAVDQGRIRIEGPTNRLVLVTPGSTETIGGLVPGSYSVTLEGLSNNQVATYGTRSGVNVIAGSTNNVSVTLQSFVPTIQSIPGTEPPPTRVPPRVLVQRSRQLPPTLIH